MSTRLPILHRFCFCFAIFLLIPPVAASAQSTVLVFQSEPGDYIGQGQSSTYTPGTADEFTVQRNFQGGISAFVSGPGFWWNLDFSTRDGAPLAVGYYTGALRYPFAKLNALNISGSGRGCNTLTGRFLVRELVYDASGNVLQAAIDAEQHCEDTTPALFAAIRFNSSVAPDLFPGSIGKYAINITPSAHGVVSGDGISCGGAVQACTVVFGSATTAMLTAIPGSGYMFNGWTGACSGGETITVNVNMVRDCAPVFEATIPTAPRTRFSFTSAAGDYIGQGRDEVYSPLNSVWVVNNWSGSTLDIHVDGGGTRYSANWTIFIKPPTNLVLGQWVDANRFGDGGLAGLDISGEGRGCNTVYGRYRVHEWRRDPNTGALIALALDFEQRCEQQTAPLLAGALHYRATFEIQITCTTPDPFVGLGGGTCYNGGWLPPGMTAPQTTADQTAPPPPSAPATPPATNTCTSPDPFAALGGGVCYNGGWLPPGMTPPDVVPTAPPPATPPPPAPLPSSCTTADPFAAMGGGTCYNGGWLPPGMPVPAGSTQSPSSTPPPPPPSSVPGVCSTPDPFIALGGGTCYQGGWLPPGMPIPGGG